MKTSLFTPAVLLSFLILGGCANNAGNPVVIGDKEAITSDTAEYFNLRPKLEKNTVILIL